jgi:hypothetical protein
MPFTYLRQFRFLLVLVFRKFWLFSRAFFGAALNSSFLVELQIYTSLILTVRLIASGLYRRLLLVSCFDSNVATQCWVTLLYMPPCSCHLTLSLSVAGNPVLACLAPMYCVYPTSEDIWIWFVNWKVGCLLAEICHTQSDVTLCLSQWCRSCVQCGVISHECVVNGWSLVLLSM